MRNYLVLGATMTAFMSSTAAGAQVAGILPLDTSPGQFYITIAGDYARQPQGQFNFLETCVQDPNDTGDCLGSENTPFLKNNKHAHSYGGGATLGYTLPSSGWGERQRIELSFDILKGKATASRTTTLTGDNPFVSGQSVNLLMIGIDGGSFMRCEDLAATPPDCASDSGGGSHKAIYSNDDYLDITASSRLKHDKMSFVARYLLDFRVAPRVTVTANIGAVYDHNRVTYRARAQWVDPVTFPDGAGDTVLAALDERVKTNRWGVELGTTFSYNASEHWRLFAGMNSHIMRQRATLSGHDCLSREYGGSDPGPVPSECTYSPTDPVDEQGFATSASSRLSKTVVAFVLTAGTSYKFSNDMVLAGRIFGAYEPTVNVVNPSHPHTDDFLPVRPAHLENSHQWIPGAALSFTIAFGGASPPLPPPAPPPPPPPAAVAPAMQTCPDGSVILATSSCPAPPPPPPPPAAERG